MGSGGDDLGKRGDNGVYFIFRLLYVRIRAAGHSDMVKRPQEYQQLVGNSYCISRDI